MEKFDRIRQSMWWWMGGYSLLIGIMTGWSFAEVNYWTGQQEFNGGAMLIGIIISFILLAPAQLYLSALREMLSQQEKQTDSLIALVNALAPKSAKPPKASATPEA